MTNTKLQIDLQNIVIKLPENQIIVNQQEYDELEQKASKGRYLTLSEVLDMLSVSRP